MSSEAQVAANRANAQQSTGPRSDQGKETAKMNALKHGLTGQQVVIKGEDPAEYDRLRGELFESYAPVGAVEEMLVDRIHQTWWRIQRAYRLEPEVTRELGEIAVFTDDKASKKYSLFLRYRTSLDRSWQHAMRELQKLQTARAKKTVLLAQAEATRLFLASRQASQSKAPATPNGFVSQTPHPNESLPLSCRL